MNMTTTTHTERSNNATQPQAQPPKSQKFHPVIARLFQSKDMGPKEVEDFLSWDLKKLPAFTELKDLDKACKRILEAIEKKQKIGIYGDYDVDGTTSCALMYHFFKSIQTEVELVQPSRFIEGYGIHPPAIDQAIEKNIELLITVDCGITNNEAAIHAKEKGLDLIITDHHKDGRDEMPPAYAVVNPSRRDEDPESELKFMAGVTVAFAVCVRLREMLLEKGHECPSLYPLLQFVAIGTVCDLVPLSPMNLKLTRHGLKQMPQTSFPGIRTFLPPEERKLEFTPSEKLSFLIGPMINSKGRLDHPEKALELLISDDSDHARLCFNHLEIANRERKFIQAQVFEEAREQVLKEMKGEDLPIIIVYNPEWHEGVIGIVASKLVESFKVPAIVFTNAEDKNLIKASARSAGDMSIFEALNEHKELFAKFGGHKAAAGLSMPKENFESFKTSMTKYVANIPLALRTVQESYDLDIVPEEIDPKLVKDLEKLEPFGMGNQKPVFRMTNFILENYDILKDVHVRWNFRSASDPKIKLKGISFNYIGKWGMLHPEELFNHQKNNGEGLTAYFTLGINRFNGNEYIQLMVNKIEPSDLI